MVVQSDKPRLPSLQEFTPDQLDGPSAMFELLEMAEGGAKRAELRERIRLRWFAEAATARSDGAARRKQQENRSGNLISGARNAGLFVIDGDLVGLTDAGAEILAISRTYGADAGFAEFASFLLRERRGIELIEISRFLKRRDGQVTKTAVDKELKARGFQSSTNSADSSKLRLWLQTAQVVDKSWNVDEDRFAKLAGLTSADIGEWGGLSRPQRQFLMLLRLRAEGDRTPIPSRDIVFLLEQRGVDFNPAQIRAQIYRPLLEGGWVSEEAEAGGRSGSAGRFSPTQRTLDLDIEKLDGLELGALPPELQEDLARPLDDIFNDLVSPSKYERGIALELLSLKLAAGCGLVPVDLRVRGAETGGAEVDLVAEGAHLHFSRWLFQCKNVEASVGLDVLAKEVGMASLLRAQVVVLVTTSTFRKSVVEYARQAAIATSIQIILIDKSLLAEYRRGGAKAIREELHERAVLALSLKRTQLAEVPTEAGKP